jgi:crossover junction endodeoxyribonuclease RusA
VRLTLPWPDRRLSPNARIHWRAKAPVTKQARSDAAYLTYAATSGGMRELRQTLGGEGPIPLTVTFYPPDKRHRDDDSMVSSFKAARDGIADALGVNDRRFRPTYQFADPEKPGRIEVAFSLPVPVSKAPDGEPLYFVAVAG